MVSNDISEYLQGIDSNVFLAIKGGREVLGRIVFLEVQVGA